MRYYMIITGICFLMLNIFGCSASNGPSGKTIEPGDYTFIMTDSLGAKLTEGKLRLDTITGGKLKGTYEFTKHYVDDFPGLSTMKGICDGTVNIKTGVISLNMNPKIADANVYIGAVAGKNGFKGDWSYSTIVGIKSKGGFKAVLVK